MLARSGVVGKKSSRHYLGPSEAIFSMDRKNRKIAKKMPIFLGGPMGPYSPLEPLIASSVWGTILRMPAFARGSLLWSSRPASGELQRVLWAETG